MCTRAGQLSAGRLWHDFQTYPQARKMPSVLTHRASSGTHILDPTRAIPALRALLFNLFLEPQAQPHVQVAIATKACGQQPTCTTRNLTGWGKAQVNTAVLRLSWLWGCHQRAGWKGPRGSGKGSVQSSTFRHVPDRWEGWSRQRARSSSCPVGKW